MSETTNPARVALLQPGEHPWGVSLAASEAPKWLWHDFNNLRHATASQWVSAEPRVGEVIAVRWEDGLALAIVTAVERGRVEWKPLALAYDDETVLWIEPDVDLIGPRVP